MHTNTIPPSWWDLPLHPHTRLVHLALLGLADRDGVLQISTSKIADLVHLDRREVHGHVITLSRKGLISLWQDETPLAYWHAWVVHTTEWTPTRGKTSRPRDSSLPSPPREVVMETLRTLWGREPTTQEARGICPRAWGRVRPTKSTQTEDQDVLRVWEGWRDRQERPGACVLGDAARQLITRAMREATPDQLLTLFRYAWESDEPGPRFWRGANDRQRRYLGLDNLLVASKLAGRVQSALSWAETLQEGETEGDGTDLGPMARYRRSRRDLTGPGVPTPSDGPPTSPGGRVGPPGTVTSPQPRPIRLSRQCRTMLDLFLERGDLGVSTSELAGIALKYSARVSELRGAGVDVVCVERSPDGNNRYAMMNWQTWSEEGARGMD